MARGWESKSVEDQIGAAELARAERAGAELTAEARAVATRRQTLQLSRARTLQSLQAACNPLHRALLEATLESLDTELKSLEG
jgi:hypothetical protein